MAVQLLYDMAGASEERTDDEAIAWAVSNGIAAGYTDGSFRPQERITRQQMATMLYQYAKYAGVDVSASGDLSGYRDASSISSYAVTPMKWACGAGVMSGRTNGQLDPRGTILYKEAQRMIANYGTVEER